MSKNIEDKVDKLNFKGIPIPKPRMTKADRWKKRPIVERYYGFKDAINEQAKKQRYTPTNMLWMKFKMPIPKSRKDIKDGDLHLQRPDCDNLQKAVQDALLKEDSNIWFVIAYKVWSNDPGIEIHNLDLDIIQDLL